MLEILLGLVATAVDVNDDEGEDGMSRKDQDGGSYFLSQGAALPCLLPFSARRPVSQWCKCVHSACICSLTGTLGPPGPIE